MGFFQTGVIRACQVDIALVTSLKAHPLPGPPEPLELQLPPRKVPPETPYSFCAIW